MSDLNDLYASVGRVVFACLSFAWAALCGSCAWGAAKDGARLMMEVWRP